MGVSRTESGSLSARRRSSAFSLSGRRLSLPTWVISIVGGFVLWELTIDIFQPSPLIIVGPSAIFQEFMHLARTGDIWLHVGVSLRAFVLGYAVSAAIAVPLGLIMGASRIVRNYLDPWVNALYATPSVSLAPLFIVWLGFGMSSKVAIVALLAFFPIIINTTAGVLAVDKDLREVGAAFGANRLETFVHLLLPGSVPYIMAGLRLAIGRGLVGVVVADLFGASSGLGYLILTAAQNFNTATVFVGTIILAMLGVALSSLLHLIERRVAPWRVEG
jgi:ABC-type nitrate/sulfonate/bicarbonate transport system permease component